MGNKYVKTTSVFVQENNESFKVFILSEKCFSTNCMEVPIGKFNFLVDWWYTHVLSIICYQRALTWYARRHTVRRRSTRCIPSRNQYLPSCTQLSDKRHHPSISPDFLSPHHILTQHTYSNFVDAS